MQAGEVRMFQDAVAEISGKVSRIRYKHPC